MRVARRAGSGLAAIFGFNQQSLFVKSRNVFFKLRAGELSHHLRRRNNCTSPAEANTTITTTTHTNNTLNITLHHLIRGEKPNESHQELRRCL
jgi:hypothetical protein